MYLTEKSKSIHKYKKNTTKRNLDDKQRQTTVPKTNTSRQLYKNKMI